MEYNSVPILNKIRKRQASLKSKIKSTQDAEHLMNFRLGLQCKISELELIKNWIIEG